MNIPFIMLEIVQMVLSLIVLAHFLRPAGLMSLSGFAQRPYLSGFIGFFLPHSVSLSDQICQVAQLFSFAHRLNFQRSQLGPTLLLARTIPKSEILALFINLFLLCSISFISSILAEQEKILASGNLHIAPKRPIYCKDILRLVQDFIAPKSSQTIDIITLISDARKSCVQCKKRLH